MPRRRSSNRCPSCGTTVKEPYKTWQLVSPIPDSKGRITITIMGMFRCPSCNRKWRGVVGKLKVGGGGIDIEGAGKSKKVVETEEAEEEPYVIEIDADEL